MMKFASVLRENLRLVSGAKASQIAHQTRLQAGDVAHMLAQAMFLAALATIPWRYRFRLLARAVPPIYADYTDFLLFASDALMIGTLLVWLLGLWLRPRRIHLGPRLIWLPLVGLTLSGLISVPTSFDPALSSYHALRLILLGGFYLYVVNETPSLRRIAIAAGVLVASQSIVALGQVLTQHSLGWGALGELALDPSWNGVSIVWAAGTRALRAYGLTDHPNLLGGSLTFALLILLAQFSRREAAGWRILLAGIICLGLVGLLYTFSRSAWLAFGAGGLFTAWRLVNREKRARGEPAARGELTARGDLVTLGSWLQLGLVSVIILSPFLLHTRPYLGMRFGLDNAFRQPTQENQSLGERQLLNQAANQIFARHALLGVGLGAFPVALRASEPQWPLNYQPPHLTLLEAASEIGLVGACFYAALLIAPWAALFFKRKQPGFSIELICASALLLAITLVGLFDYYPWLLVPGRTWQWLAWGWWAGSYMHHIQAAQGLSPGVAHG